jgi:hypothetical protein
MFQCTAPAEEEKEERSRMAMHTELQIVLLLSISPCYLQITINPITFLRSPFLFVHFAAAAASCVI